MAGEGHFQSLGMGDEHVRTSGRDQARTGDLATDSARRVAAESAHFLREGEGLPAAFVCRAISR